jgi:ferritin
MEQAILEKDHASQIFLQWFVTEQVEEEANAGDVIARLKMAGETGAGLLMVDGELATRLFIPPTATAA